MLYSSKILSSSSTQEDHNNSIGAQSGPALGFEEPEDDYGYDDYDDPRYYEDDWRDELDDCKSPYNQYWDMMEERARIDKEKWYLDQDTNLAKVLDTIVTVTVVSSPDIAAIIIEFLSFLHPDDADELEDNYGSDEDPYLEYSEDPDDTEPESEPEPMPNWWIKGFDSEQEYDLAVKAAKKKWHRTRDLARRWRGKWRWKRHDKAHAALVALTWP